MPWVLARVARETVPVMMAVPETRPRFQPSPSRATEERGEAAEALAGKVGLMG